jgi:hypothetical protein
MGTRQEEVLRATAAAATVFQRFPLGRRTSFDIVGAIVELGIPLLFRPLSALWGASVMVGPHIQVMRQSVGRSAVLSANARIQP